MLLTLLKGTRTASAASSQQPALNRRALLALAGSASALAACDEIPAKLGEVPEKLATAFGQKPGPPPPIARNLTLQEVGYTPQFYLMERGVWKDFVELAFSFHCGATRDWFRANGKKLANDIQQGRTVAYCSHLIRSVNEIPVGVELMSVGQQAYPEAVVATLGLTMRLDRAVSVDEVRQLIASMGFPREGGLNPEDAELRLYAVAKAYHHGLGINETPFVKRSKFQQEA